MYSDPTFHIHARCVTYSNQFYDATNFILKTSNLLYIGATRVVKMDGMSPNDDVTDLWEKLRGGQEGETLALCGHLPFLNRCH
jgi:hypothetical protein